MFRCLINQNLLKALKFEWWQRSMSQDCVLVKSFTSFSMRITNVNGRYPRQTDFRKKKYQAAVGYSYIPYPNSMVLSLSRPAKYGIGETKLGMMKGT